jgi:hypothetical protein
MNLVEPCPKVQKLGNLADGDTTFSVNIGNPKITVNAFLDREVFPLGDIKDGWRDVIWLHTSKPWRMPKNRSTPFPFPMVMVAAA